MRTAKLVSVPAVKEVRTAERPRSFLFGLAGGLCALLLAAGACHSAEEHIGGRFVSVPSTISSDAINRIRQTVESEYKRFKGTAPQGKDVIPRFKVVFDFNPNGRENRNLDFGLCSNLAEVVRDLRAKGMETIAYIHGPVAGHMVLPVLTCQFRVLAREGSLGPVMIDGMSSLEDYKQNAYHAHGATEINKPLISKLFESKGEVRRSKTRGFVWAQNPDAADT